MCAVDELVEVVPVCTILARKVTAQLKHPDHKFLEKMTRAQLNKFDELEWECEFWGKMYATYL